MFCESEMSSTNDSGWFLLVEVSAIEVFLQISVSLLGTLLYVILLDLANIFVIFIYKRELVTI